MKTRQNRIATRDFLGWLLLFICSAAAAAALSTLSTVLVPKVNCILSSQTNGHEGMEMGRRKRRRW